MFIPSCIKLVYCLQWFNTDKGARVIVNTIKYTIITIKICFYIILTTKLQNIRKFNEKRDIPIH